MIGIVIVSHSPTLAEGVRELARQMMQNEVPLAVAGGIDDPDNPIGTDSMKVYEAIQSVYSDEGVIVLMDLGSAVLSAETALEFLDPEQRANVYLTPAPLIEGAVAAVTSASIGLPVAQVLEEARSALAAKAEQLQPLLGEAASAPPPPEAAAPLPAEGLELTLTVTNRLGLHARPAARFVGLAGSFQSEIWVSKGDKTANARSLNKVTTLDIRQGDTITIRASGPDAGEALAAIKALADDNFGDPPDDKLPEEVAPPPPAPSAEAGVLTGLGVSAGYAVGPVGRFETRIPEIVARSVEDPAAERERLRAATEAARREIRDLRDRTARMAGEEEAAIFEAHEMFLDDPELEERVWQILSGERLNAEVAWHRVIEQAAAEFRALDNPYMQARAADVLDVGQRVLHHLMGAKPATRTLSAPSIVVADDLTPSDTAQLDPALVLGICTALGGPTSHSAILSRALGIPSIVGMGPALDALEDGQVVGIDGEAGQLWPNPDEAVIARLQAQRKQWLQAQQQARASAQEKAATKDGHPIEVAANVGGVHDAGVALEYGAEGIGLLRTEFLFMNRDSAPTEDEQVSVYREIASAMDSRPVIIRTLDVGADKPLPYYELGEEANPFLGWRGIRFCLDSPEILKTQLRAVLRVSAEYPVRLMFPMISTLEEVRRAKALLAEVQAALRADHVPFDEQMQVGIMIEVPAAVMTAPRMAREVDFFSIGTNDLTQYVMAADRGNARVAGIANPLQPAVLAMIAQVAQAAHDAGIWAGMCGELAGNPLAAPLLVGLGLDELSMSAPSIPAVKEALRTVTLEDTRRTAADVLALSTLDEVLAYLERPAE
ncbi:MAG: phosphoenolpyruvate--protein phosphotransferase [Anaerolineae bacterium]